jgi:iron-sulfur cluster repair protein YtfE (RIC family)
MFSNRINQRLHEEHRATAALMERLAALLAGRGGAIPASGSGTICAALLREIAGGVESEVGRHFDFEEQSLFPFLGAGGETEIGTHLTSEHVVMRPLWERLVVLARAASSTGFDAAGWNEFRRVGLDLSEQMLAHIEKEEMALLPLLEDSMDAQTNA